MGYETVIGLEVHVQIKTESKLFCPCATAFGAPPNSNVCPICCGYPGVLPVLNRKAVESLIKTALAVNCAVREESIFARKQYFYPDLPKNYQISQYEKPLAEHGHLLVSSGKNSDGPAKKVGITRIHLEEDAGKLLHTVGAVELNGSLVDLNRAGIPLMEIVSEPDLRSSQEAQDYLATLKMILQYLEVSDCDMEKGSLRCDANVSIRPEGVKTLGTKVEIKNMNSFRGVRDAIEFEISRQTRALDSGERITQETRLWDADKAESRSMRSKEQAHDYRYFPEPDLLPLLVGPEQIDAIRQGLPELPAQRKNRFVNEYQISEYDAAVLTADKAAGDFYEKSVKHALTLTQKPAAKLISNWITTELSGRLNQSNKTIPESPVSPQNLAKLVKLILDDTISGKIAKTVFEEMWKSGGDPERIVQEKKLVQVLDQNQIMKWVEEAIAQNQNAAEEFRNGKERAIGAIVGTVMKVSKGQANPEIVNKLIKEKLASN